MEETLKKLKGLGWGEISYGLVNGNKEVEILDDYKVIIKVLDYQTNEYYAPELSLEELKYITLYVEKLKEK